MYKGFQLYFGHSRMYIGYLLHRQLPCQYHSFKAQGSKPTYLFGGSAIALCTGVQRYVGLQLFLASLQQSHILNQQSIDLSFFQFANKLQHIVHLVVVDDSIHRYMYLCTKLMGIIAQRCYVFYTIASRLPCAKLSCTDIYGICTVVYCCYSTSQVLGWSQQFYCSYLIILALHSNAQR